MKKKAVALLLGLTLVLSSLTGCGGTGSGDQKAQDSKAPSEEKSSETSKEEEESGGVPEGSEDSGEIALDAFAGTEITVGLFLNALDKSDDVTEKTIVKMAEEATGIKVNFVRIDSESVGSRVSVMMADPDSMPDMMLSLVGEGDIRNDPELFYDLSEEGLLQTYAPNILADYEHEGLGLDTITWPDGSIRSLMNGAKTSIGSAVDGIMWVNKEWLAKLEMEVPTTLDEFLDMLRAFRDNDMDGDGDTSNEIPYLFANNFGMSRIYELAGLWGIAGPGADLSVMRYMIEDGKIVSTLDRDEFREYIEFVHKMIEEGVIDKEGFSQTYEQFAAKLADGQVGCFYGWTPHTYMDKELALQYTWVEPFPAKDGVEPLLAGRANDLFANRCGVVFNARTENIEAALWWWNYISSSTENKWTSNCGPVGKYWGWKEGEEGRTPVNLEMDEADLPSSWNQANYSYSYGLTGGGIGPFMRKDELAYVDFVTDPTTDNAYRFAAIDVVAKYAPKEVMPSRFVEASAYDDIDLISTELSAYVSNFVGTSMMEGLTDAAWEEHLNKLTELQYYDYLDWYQKYYDGTL